VLFVGWIQLMRQEWILQEQLNDAVLATVSSAE
jgi:hypothetical protein